MQSLLQQEPVWKMAAMYRLGPKHRTHEDRLTYIDGMGWFVRMRGEFNTLNGLTSSSGIAGPFSSRLHAQAYLRGMIQQLLSQTNS